jgi:hypothetical protein
METRNVLKIDRMSFEVASLHETSKDKRYWLSQSPYERLRTVEILRQINYGYHQSTSRLQRIVEIAER